MKSTMEADRLQTFIDDVGLVVSSTDDEHEITARVGELMSALLASGYRLPPEVTRASSVRHVTYPLYIAPDESWSVFDCRTECPAEIAGRCLMGLSRDEAVATARRLNDRLRRFGDWEAER
jgi:predicted metal-dependent enzyme (double-stranded beta helix superfamily)